MALEGGISLVPDDNTDMCSTADDGDIIDDEYEDIDDEGHTVTAADQFYRPSLMPYREQHAQACDFIKTTPQIQIHKNGPPEKLYVPPSKCVQTLHERFTDIHTKLLKRQINPFFGGPDARIRFPVKYRLNGRIGGINPRFNKAQYLVAMRLKKRSIIQSLPIKARLGWYGNTGNYWGRKFNWFGNRKSRSELDSEIDDYMAKKGKINSEVDCDEAQSVPNKFSQNRTKFAFMMAKIKQWGNVSKKSLDDDIDDYMTNSKTTLDADLDTYMSKAAELKKQKSSGNLCHDINAAPIARVEPIKAEAMVLD